jgi:hypothetical protein
VRFLVIMAVSVASAEAHAGRAPRNVLLLLRAANDNKGGRHAIMALPLLIAPTWSANDTTDYLQILTGREAEVGTQPTVWAIMQFCMPWPQNKARLCFKRRTISRPRFATMQ